MEYTSDLWQKDADFIKKQIGNKIDALNEYSLILFLEPDVAFVQDGDRSEVIHRDRTKYSEQLKAILHAHGKNFISISGDYHARYELAVTAVEKLLGKKVASTAPRK